MRFGIDNKGIRTFIDDTSEYELYFCQHCHGLLIQKKGDIKAHHFAHQKGFVCTDTWKYGDTPWFFSWQDRFPKECQEVIKEYNGERHAADIVIESMKVVIELYDNQNSNHQSLSSGEFDNRNEFFNNLGYKVIWIFNFVDEYDCKVLYKKHDDLFYWKRKKTTFKNVDNGNNKIKIFYQIEHVVKDNPRLIEYNKYLDKNAINDIDIELKDYYLHHKDDLGYLIKVDRYFDEDLKEFSTGGYEYYVDEFFSLFIDKVDVNYKIDPVMIYDILSPIDIRNEKLNFGCTESSLGCASGELDINNTINSLPIGDCRKCKHYRSGKENKCYKKIDELNLQELHTIRKVTKYKGGQIKEIQLLFNNEIKTFTYPLMEYEKYKD